MDETNILSNWDSLRRKDMGLEERKSLDWKPNAYKRGLFLLWAAIFSVSLPLSYVCLDGLGLSAILASSIIASGDLHR